MKMKASAMTLLLLLLLAGCVGTQPTVLHAVRPSLVGYHQHVVPPFDRTVRDAAAVQRLYVAALALPRPQQYPAPCPPDFGLVYHVTFLDGTSQLQQIDVDPLGCNWVYLSQADVRQADQAFLTLLAHTIGLPSLIPAGLLPRGEDGRYLIRNPSSCSSASTERGTEYPGPACGGRTSVSSAEGS